MTEFRVWKNFRGAIVRRNKFSGSRLRWARSATKHRIARQRSQHIVERCPLCMTVPAPSGRDGDRVLFVGDDREGVALEVIGVETDEGALMVIHAMALRDRYRDHYREVKKWQR